MVGRRQSILPPATADYLSLPSENYIRALLTLPTYGASGEVEFFAVLGGSNTMRPTSEATSRSARGV